MKLDFVGTQYEELKQLFRELYAINNTHPVDVDAWQRKNDEIKDFMDKVPLV